VVGNDDKPRCGEDSVVCVSCVSNRHAGCIENEMSSWTSPD
jgi:hypothetical protein